MAHVRVLFRWPATQRVLECTTRRRARPRRARRWLPVSDGSAAEGRGAAHERLLTALLKVFFLQFAANQPSHIVKADDDTLFRAGAAAYADAMPPRYFAGVFESSSWIPSRRS